MDSPVTKNWTPLAFGYLALSLTGLIGTWTFDVLAVRQVRDFVGDWVGSGPAVSSLTVDLLVAAVAFAFPLFLAMRERALAAARVCAVGAASPGD